jgi:hypothetical protein
MTVVATGTASISKLKIIPGITTEHYKMPLCHACFAIHAIMAPRMNWHRN